MYSANAGDPCYSSAGFTSSVCTMAYRWHLDYVVDVHGNAMAYYYDQATNGYAQDANTSSAVSYVRDSYLAHIDYGFTDGNAYGTVPDKVLFTTGDRCVSGSACDPLSSSTASDWPDVPYDLNCTPGQFCDIGGPSMWSTVALAGITTEQYNGSSYATVDSYAFTQTMPAPGDGTSATLWLSSITRTGEDTTAGGTSVTMPAVTFAGIQEPNRTDPNVGGPALDRYRINDITTETGSQISVSYELTNPCAVPVTVTPSSNTSSCYPVYWTQPGGTGPFLDWFNSYAVADVSQSDPSGGSAGLYSSYAYPSGPAWHYDDNELVQAKYRTYGQYRGYGDVITYDGQGSDPLTESETTYYQGMSDDNDTTPVTLLDSQGGKHDDTDQLSGDTLESTSYNFKGGPKTGSTITSYWVSPAQATRTRTGLPPLTANFTGPVETWTRTALTDTGTTTWRETETDTTYDTTANDPDYGLPTVQYQHGDLSLSGNNQVRCTLTSYAPANTTTNLVGLVAQVQVLADPCSGANPAGASAPTSAQINVLAAPTNPDYATDTVSDTLNSYDLQPPGSTTEPSSSPTQGALTHGDLSEIQVANGYAQQHVQLPAEIRLDLHQRTAHRSTVGTAWGTRSSTAYTMANGVVTGTTVTNALGQTMSTVDDPMRGLAMSGTDANGITTTTEYDGLGRTIAVWSQSRATSTPANELYSYTLGTATTPTVVTTQSLNDAGGYVTSTTLYDALLRVRQIQTSTPQGGRLIDDTFYDSHGWTVKTNSNYWDTTTTPDGVIMSVADDLVQDQAQDAYNGAGQVVQTVNLDDSQVKSTTYAVYYGDTTVTIPGVNSSGVVTGTPTATVTDALGRTTALEQYATAPTVTASTTGGITTVTETGGTPQTTSYTFDNVGQQTQIQTPDPTGTEQWNTTYDMLGQVLTKQDPDAGLTSTMKYDADETCSSPPTPTATPSPTATTRWTARPPNTRAPGPIRPPAPSWIPGSTTTPTTSPGSPTRSGS